jgi:PAS domain S-box-containing protein
MQSDPEPSFTGDRAAAAMAGVLPDRRDLAFVAMERTRMPMVITDPNLPDNPIVLANHAFLELTGYDADEVVGRNCRFLQGRDTDPATVDEIRAAIREVREITVELKNYDRQGRCFWNQLMLSPVRDEDGQLLYFFGSQLDVTERRRARELEAAEHRLLREVDHRAKNALALVQGIVRLSRADDPEDYARAVQGRVDALARAHGLLSDNRWHDLPIARLVQIEAEPFGVRRVTASGPALLLSAAQVQPVALVLHELLTNAAQHGALSHPGGTVAIGWQERDDGLVTIEWNEAGGPPPPEDRQTGFGMQMIDSIIRRQLQGRAHFSWAATGLTGSVSFPGQRQAARYEHDLATT